MNIMKRIFYLLSVISVMASCKGSENIPDASGTFEADEVIVSSELAGRILSLTLKEGDTLSKGTVAAVIDASNLELQKEQVEASIGALKEKTTNVAPQVKLLHEQITVQQSQLSTWERDWMA